MGNPEFDFGNMATMDKTVLKQIIKLCQDGIKNIERLEVEYAIPIDKDNQA
jgi:hypothetical protein